MKKLIAVISSISLFSLSTLTVVSCSIGDNYGSIFNYEADGNDGEYINDATAKVMKKMNSLIKEPMSMDIKLPSTSPTRSAQILNDAQKQNVIDQIQSILVEQLSLTSSSFRLSIYADNTFRLPELVGITNQNLIVDDAYINYGNVRVALYYLNQRIFESDLEWFLPEYKIISEVANLLNSNGLGKLEDIFHIKKIDIPIGSFDMGGMAMTLTLGTLSSMINLLSIVYGIMGDAGTAIQDLMAMNVDALAGADPNTGQGRDVYEKFDLDFRNNLKRIFTGINIFLENFGMKPVFELPPLYEGAEPKTITIDKLLEINLFDIINFDPSKLNIHTVQDGTDVTVHVDLASRGVPNYLRMIDLLANIAPNVVLILNKFLNKDTYDTKKGGTKNIVFLLLRLLLTPMDKRLLAIQDKNDDEFVIATSGFGSILINILMGYDKNKRTKNVANFYFHLRIDIIYDMTIKDYFIRLIDDDLPALLGKIIINFERIILDILNQLFILDGATDDEKYFDLNKPIISNKGNLVLINNNDVDWNKIMDGARGADGDTLNGAISDIIVSMRDSIVPMIVENVNTQVQEAFPIISLQDIINMVPGSMLEKLGIDEENLEGTEISIVKAKFRFEFYSDLEKAWIPMVGGINYRTFEIYSGVKLNFANMQFQIIYNKGKNNSYTLLTRDDITYDIVFSSDDL